MVRNQVGNKLELEFLDQGEKTVKNIAQPVHVYFVDLGSAPVAGAAPPAPGAAASPHSDKPSVAILPFSNMSNDPEQEFFSDGITEDIITDLSKVSGLFVLSRNTVFTYKGKAVNMEQIAKQLGVAYVVEGSVRKAGNRVRINAQLIEGATGGHLWADRYDRDLTDIFAIQDEITKTIVDQLKVKLLPEEKKAIEQAPTENVEAYTHYLKGRELFHRGSKSYYAMAKQMFAKAIELDPLFARAYAGAADCNSFLYLDYSEGASLDGILANCTKALDLDPGLAEARASRALAFSASRRYEEAAKEFEIAIASNPTLFEADTSTPAPALFKTNSSRQLRIGSAPPRSSLTISSALLCPRRPTGRWGDRRMKRKRVAEPWNEPSACSPIIPGTLALHISLPSLSRRSARLQGRRNGLQRRWPSTRMTS